MPKHLHESERPSLYSTSIPCADPTPESCRVCFDAPVSAVLPLPMCARCGWTTWRALDRRLGPMLDQAEDDAAGLAVVAAGLPPRQPVDPGWVYYIRRADLIKIGHTLNLQRRMQALLPDEVLAVEPGPMQLEAMRHQQFAAHHFRNEYFTDHPDLRSHIAFVLEHCGPPPTGLPTLTRGRRIAV